MPDVNEQHSPYRLSMTPESREYIGSAAVDFLNKNVKLKSNILVITSADIEGLEKHDPVATQLLSEHHIHRQADAMDRFLTFLQKKGSHYNPREYPYIYIEQVSSKEHAFSALSGLPEDKLEHIPGSVQDWRFSFLAHEIGHHFDLPDIGTKINPENEANADRFQGTLSEEAARQGLLQTNDLDMATASARAIQYIIEGYKDSAHHEHGAAISTLPSDGEQIPQQQYGLWRAREDIIQQVSDKLTTEDDRINARLDAIQMMNSIASLDLPRDIQQQLDKSRRGDLSIEESRALAEKIRIPESRQDDFNFEYQRSLRFVALDGGDRIPENPDILYKTALQMYKDGAFNTNAQGKEMVKNFINGVERYAPTHFQTNGQHTFPSTDSRPENLVRQNSETVTGNNTTDRTVPSSVLDRQIHLSAATL